VSAASEQRRKHGTGEKNPAGGGSTRLKGGAGTQRRGGRESGDAWGGVGETEGGPSAIQNGSGGRHRPPAGERVRRCCRATAAGCGTRATYRRDRVTAGPGGQQWGVGRARPHDVVLTRGPIAQCMRFNSV
jgi:hypothetical protein